MVGQNWSTTQPKSEIPNKRRHGRIESPHLSKSQCNNCLNQLGQFDSTPLHYFDHNLSFNFLIEVFLVVLKS